MSATAPVVKADPTKTFFITMLVRDIALVPAIVDLVDNSVDGARRLRPAVAARSEQGADLEAERFKGLWINIRVSKDGFEISDNCGGMSWETASEYAFRFGRPEDAPETPHSIGQFGIGMKRSLFKLGTKFRVESATQEERFILRVDVDKWRRDPDWVFKDVVHSVTSRSAEETGTKITVEPLHASVAEDFQDNIFQNQLRAELSRAHQSTMNQGLTITLNTVPVDVDIQTLLRSDALQPARLDYELQSDTDKPVHVQILAGIGPSSPTDAGWYVYCNGRLILGPDRSQTTGWGEGKGKTLPQYHNQFSRFRGFVFFESADVAKLPWTTTKEGVDRDHPTYRAVRPEMLRVARPVIDFLNALDAEKEQASESGRALEAALVNAEKAGPVPIAQLPSSPKFVAPLRKALPPKPHTQSIQYSRPIKQIDDVKSVLKLGTAREVGEATFDYFYRRQFGVDDE